MWCETTKILVLAFDGLDADLVEEYKCTNLFQEARGRIDLTKHARGGGNPDFITDELYATFLTGTIPDTHGVKGLTKSGFTLSGKIDTIFDFGPSLAIDVPTWNRHPYHEMFQKRVGTFFGQAGHRVALGLDEDEYWRKVCHEREYLRTEIYRYLNDDKIPRVYSTLNTYNTPVSMAYFWFSDILGHITPNGYLLEELYQQVDKIVETFRLLAKNFWDDPTVLIISDHGMKNGFHDHRGAFWSLSKPLLNSGDNPDLTDWYGLIEGWITDV